MIRSNPFLIRCGLPLAICLAAAFSGCSDDDPARPISGTRATFDNIWPATVGQHWIYDLKGQLHTEDYLVYERPEDIPPIPPMEDLYADLGVVIDRTPVEETRGTFRQVITSDATVDPDTVVMNVELIIQNQEGYPSPPWGLGMGPSWRHSGDRIASYGYGQLGWVHLEGSLEPGHEFTTTWSEGPARFDTLFSRIWRTRSFDVMGQSISNCVECFYVRDMGIQQATDENGDPQGYFQAYMYGMVVFAPEIGPVYCKEKFATGVDMFEIRAATMIDSGTDDKAGVPST